MSEESPTLAPTPVMDAVWRKYRPAKDSYSADKLRRAGEDLERRLAAITAKRDALLAVVNALADKRWFLDNVGAECTFEGSPMVQIGHLEELVEMAESALRVKAES